MKLIEILVKKHYEEGWEWPEGSTRCMQTDGAWVTFPDIGDHCDFLAKCMVDGVRISTREQYEAALAARKDMLINKPQPVWNGEGLPPVGSRMQALTAGDWVEVTVAYHDKKVSWKECLVFDIKTTRPFWADEFRPIRTEAERKRSDICDKIYGALCKAEREANRSDMAECVYDAIAAGKIPGVKLEAPDDH